MTKLLLVEDDERLSSLIAEYLSANAFDVHVVARGDAALGRFHAFKPDIVVLDLMLPGLPGNDVCRQIRAISQVPLLVLTARDDSYDQVALLEYGADDFVNKPVQPRILLARLRALLRRAAPAPASHASQVTMQAEFLSFGALEIILTDRVIHWRGKPVILSSTEYKLMLILAESAGTVLSRDALLKKMRGIEFDGLDRSIDNSISKLRRKFDDLEGERIKTVWGEGYLFSPSAWS